MIGLSLKSAAVLAWRTHTYFDASSVAQEGRPEQRNASDAAALAAKVAKKAEMKEKQDADAARAVANQPVARKVKKKDDAGLDDLLSAGLAGKGKKK